MDNQTNTSLMKPKTITLIQINLHNCIAATNELILNATEQGIDAALVQEPYNGQKWKPPSSIKIFRSSPDSRSLIMVFNNEISVVLITTLSNQLVTTVQISNFSNMILSSIYCPPGTDNRHSNANVDHIINIMDSIAKSYPIRTFYGGDFNSHHTSWGSEKSDIKGEKISEWCYSRTLHILNDGHKNTFDTTRAGKRYTSKIDLSICTTQLLGMIQKWEVLETETMSDHKYLKIVFQANVIIPNESTNKFLIPAKKFQFFEAELSKILTKNEKLLMPGTTNIEQVSSRVDLLTELISKAAERHSIPKKRIRTQKAPWWNDVLEDQRNRIKTLMGQRRRAQTRNRAVDLSVQLLARKNRYTNEIRIARREYWKEMCQATSKDTYHETIGKIFKCVTARRGRTITIDGRTYKSAADIATALLYHHFPDSPTTPILDPANVQYNPQVSRETDHPCDSVINETEFSIAINSFKKKKAPGDDGITAEMLKVPVLRQHLLNLFNDTFALEYFPEQWKMAVIKIIPKPNKQDYSDPKSFRPIGLLSVMGKLYEKVLCSRLLHFLHSNGKLENSQYGFTPQRSAEDALHQIVSMLKANKTKGGSGLISLDIQGAFDNLKWYSVLQALRKKEVGRKLFYTVKSYLAGRSAEVRAAGASAKKNVTQGCIQGSVFGPVMWNLVLDELLSILSRTNLKVIAYADDINILFTGLNSDDEINGALNLVSEWGTENSLQFSAQKTKLLLVGKQRNARQLIFQGTALENEESVKVLGVYIDCKLNFKHHASEVIKKAIKTEKTIASISGPFWGADTEVTMLIYKTVTEKILTYACSSWSPLLIKAGHSELHKFQRRVLIRAIKGYRTTSYLSCYMLSGEMELQYTMELLTAIYKAKCEPSKYWPYEKHISFSELPPPAQRSARHYSTEYSDRASHEVYTDGSKSEFGVGIWDCSLQGWNNRK